MECLVQNKHQKEMNDKCSVGVTHFQLVSRYTRTESAPLLSATRFILCIYFNVLRFVCVCVAAGSNEGFPLLVQVQDGLQGGRAAPLSQHQEEVGPGSV